MAMVDGEERQLRILVCGSRDWTDKDAIADVLADYASEHPTVIHGAGPGADCLADDVARMYGYDVVAFPADWTQYGKAAGPMRNRQMLDMKPDLVIAFGVGRGTNDTCTEALRRGIPVRRELALALRTTRQPVDEP